MRRQINELKEGHLYVQLISELQMLEQRRSEEHSRFWQDPSQVTQYTAFMGTQSKVETLEGQIEEYEMTLGLSCLNLGTYRPEILDKIQEWEDQFFRLKIEILTRIFPELNYCHFAIYGQNPEAIGSFYQTILEQEQFEYEIKAIWFRERYYQEELHLLAEEKESEVTSNRSPYLREKVPNNELKGALKPPKPGDLCCGLEFHITGPAAFLFLEPEAGVQKWLFANDAEELYVLELNKQSIPPPDKIHRKDFFKKKTVRRVVDFVDGKQAFLKEKQDGSLKPLLSQVQEALKSQFELAVNTAFI